MRLWQATGTLPHLHSLTTHHATALGLSTLVSVSERRRMRAWGWGGGWVSCHHEVETARILGLLVYPASLDPDNNRHEITCGR